MNGLLEGIAGLIVGGAVASILATLAGRRRRCPDLTAHRLTDQDREAVTAEFAAHVSAVHRGVSEYADALAGDDPALRDRLRVFERGER